MATESDNVNSGALGTLVAVGTIAFFGIALVVTALVRAEMSEELEKKDVSADRAYKDLLAEQTAKLAAPAAYVDRARGKVSLPIDRAMELTVAGLKQDPNSATPPGPAGGTGGAGGSDAAAAGGGAGGAGGVGGGAVDGKPADEAVNAEPRPSDAGKPAEEPKEKGEEKKGEQEKEKKKAPKPAPVPAAPAPPAPAPNGQ
jgi:hypothetical protein